MKKFKIILFLFMFVFVVGCTTSNNETVKVPNFVGLKASSAQDVAKNFGLILQVISSEPNDQYPIDTIISQDPSPETEVKKGGFVKIILSSGPKTIFVPDVLGKDFGTAKSLIFDAGLTIGNINEVENDAPVGTVIAQNPDPQTVATSDTKVDLTVSIGRFVVVPNVIGKTVDEAKKILEDAGLVLYKVDTFNESVPSAPPNIVLYQYPVPNARVQQGTQVLLRVSK